MGRLQKLLFPLAAALILIGIWALAVRFTQTKVFPSPWKVILGGAQLARKGVLVRYMEDSLFRVISGYGLAVLLGIPIGMLLGWSRQSGRSVNPLIQMLRPISPLAWSPLAVVWFGVGNSAPIFLIFLGAFFPVVVATMNGVRNIPLVYMRAGDNFGLTRGRLLSKVIFPAILPRIVIALRISLGIAWLVVVAAEMIAVDSGLGYLIIDSRNAGQRYDLVVAGMVLIGIVGLMLDFIVRRAERLKSVRWAFRS